MSTKLILISSLHTRPALKCQGSLTGLYFRRGLLSYLLVQYKQALNLFLSTLRDIGPPFRSRQPTVDRLSSPWCSLARSRFVNIVPLYPHTQMYHIAAKPTYTSHKTTPHPARTLQTDSSITLQHPSTHEVRELVNPASAIMYQPMKTLLPLRDLTITFSSTYSMWPSFSPSTSFRSRPNLIFNLIFTWFAINPPAHI